jgi:ABC-type methionine transport system ATPase subunit
MAKKQVTLTFPEHLIKEPLIYTMSREYGVVPNVRRARVTETIGEVTLELEGSDQAVEQAIAYFEKKGVKVEPVIGDIVSG